LGISTTSNPKEKIPDSIFENENEFLFITAGKNNKDLLRETVIYTECIYYFAFSFKKKCDDIPGLKQFSPKGIRDVRNHIMEHPKEKFSNAFAITDSIQLRTGKYTFSESEDKWIHEDISIDPGLNRNMEEFNHKLNNLLTLRLQGK
jgi:hypothetical protein